MCMTRSLEFWALAEWREWSLTTCEGVLVVDDRVMSELITFENEDMLVCGIEERELRKGFQFLGFFNCVGSDISNKAVSFDIRTVGKTTRKPHKVSYLTAVKKSME